MASSDPDIFGNVHKGIRKALFEVCTALGRADGDAQRDRAARAQLRDVLRFVEHHGDNEDLLLLPLLEGRAPRVCARMRGGHAEIGGALRGLLAAVETAATGDLYARACWFTTLYLDHMREEEHDLDPEIRSVLSNDEIADFGRNCVARTEPADRRMMLAWMLPAMTRADVEAFLGRLSPADAAPLRALAEATSPAPV